MLTRRAVPLGRALAQMSAMRQATMLRPLDRSGACRQMAGGAGEATAPATMRTTATTMALAETHLATMRTRRTRRRAGRTSAAGGLRRAAHLTVPRRMTPARR